MYQFIVPECCGSLSVSVRYDTKTEQSAYLAKTPIRPDPIDFEAILNNHFFMHSVICIRHQSRIPLQETQIYPNTSNIKSIRASDCADAIDPRDEGVICPPSHESTARQLWACETISE